MTQITSNVNFNAKPRAGNAFSAIVSMANSIAFSHAEPETLKLTMMRKVKDSLSKLNDSTLFTSAAHLCADMEVPNGTVISFRDALIEAIATVIVYDAAQFAGKSVRLPNMILLESQHRTSPEKTQVAHEPNQIQGKTKEEMAILAADDEGGCAGGACKL